MFIVSAIPVVSYYDKTLLKTQSKKKKKFHSENIRWAMLYGNVSNRVFQGIVIVFHNHAIRFVGGTAKRVSSFILHGLYSIALGMQL